MVRTISTSFISGTGLKKCMPAKRSGRRVEVRSSVIEMEEVFDAKMASFFTTLSSEAYIFFFSSTFSMMASMTMSQSARSSFLVVPLSRARMASGDSFSVPFSANLASDFSIPVKPLSRTFCSTSSTVTSNVAVAATCAIPEPIRPQPRTPTFFISMKLCLARKFASASVLLCFCAPLCPLWLLQALHDHRNPLPAADARCRKTVLLLPAAQLIQQGNHQPCSRRPQRMSECNSAAVYIHFFAVEAQLFFHRQVLRSKGFVYFDQINVVECESGFLQRDLRRRHRATAHNFRIDASNAPTDDSAERLEVTLLCGLKRHDCDSGATIHNATGIPCRHGPVLAESRLQLGQAFHGRLRAPMIVFGEHFTRELALGILQGHGNQFFLQPSFFVRGIGAVLRPQRKFVLHLAVNALLVPVELD